MTTVDGLLRNAEFMRLAPTMTGHALCRHFEGGTLHGKTTYKIARLQALKRLEEQGALMGEPPLRVSAAASHRAPSETHTVSEDKWEVYLPSTRICTLEALLAHCKVDTSIWEVERFTLNKWEVGAKNTDGEIIVEPLFQVKATLKRKRLQSTVKAELDAMIAAAKAHSPSYTPLQRPKRSQRGHLLEISIPDLHMGKLAWNEETRGGDYDLKIAQQVFEEALEALIQKTQGFDIERICFVVGNDLLNADKLDNTTTKGTQQQVDGRYQKVFATTRQMMVRGIERLMSIADIDVLMVPGNHDSQSVYCLGDSLDCWFRASPNVTIHNEPTGRKIYRYGQCLILFAHGDKQPLKDLPLQMATDYPQEWGATRWRECHAGHLHRSSANEYAGHSEHKGVRVRVLPSLCASDSWHTDNGYTGNLRSAEAYVWDAEQGLQSIVMHTLQPPMQSHI